MYHNILSISEQDTLLKKLKIEEKNNNKKGEFPRYQEIINKNNQFFSKRFYGTRYVWSTEKESREFVFRDDIDKVPLFLKQFHDKLKDKHYIEKGFEADNYAVNTYLKYGIGYHKDKECNESPIYIYNACGMCFILYIGIKNVEYMC